MSVWSMFPRNTCLLMFVSLHHNSIVHCVYIFSGFVNGAKDLASYFDNDPMATVSNRLISYIYEGCPTKS